ncbi:PREDICTED: uncharacterized protein LOC105462443 [Wasmannia auropunctata]|uniref:uncharacterized protein LOC105462443 n=1 Tax=Wasmannia auropunctata TaxID=64793 RepID=UPI0005EF2B9C|nr:PREDICTED: uncharacterized protein LOC105462443 [Wasmannia auropunctata]
MKNQCPQCVRKRTMKMQTRVILAGCFVIVMFNDFGTSVEVSSKIDLDSNENEEKLGNSTFGTVINSKKSASPPESVLRAPKPSTFIWRNGELIKASEPRKRRIYPSHDNSAKQPKIINNIQVVVNTNDSIPSENSCEYGICNVSVSSKPDENGNIVTEVHLSIITKAKLNTKIEDVPVINGFRGVSQDDKQPIFHSINSPRSMHTHLYRNNIPQIQTNYHGYGQPWYGQTFRQPQMYWNYHFGNQDNVGLRDQKMWPRDRPVVDDKIEPPLSKTKPNDETNYKIIY